MVIDIFALHQKLRDYPAEVLSPAEQDAINMLLEYLTSVFGSQLTRTSRETQIAIIRDVVAAIVAHLRPSDDLR